MNKLFLDIGNSFVKWAVVMDGDYLTYSPLALNDILEEGLDCFGFDDMPAEVYFSSVADAHKVDELKLLVQNEWQIFPTQLTAQKSCCGLESGYADFSALGDDRWFAMQGALGIYKEPVVVVDAGTALTIDAVIDGKHQGGFIVPGLYTMRSSLAFNTADLANYNEVTPDSDNENQNLLATDTSSAILGGTLYMTGSFINQVIEDLNAQLGTCFRVIVTGGESTQLTPLLDFDFDYIPDLVLQGMVNVEESVKKQ